MGAKVDVSGTAALSSSGVGAAGGAGPTAGLQAPAGGGIVRDGAMLADFSATPGQLNAASLTGAATASGDASTDTVPGSWEILADHSGVQFGSLTLTSSSGGTGIRPPSLFTLTDGTVTVTGATSATSGGDLQVNAQGSGSLAGAGIALAAPFGPILVN